MQAGDIALCRAPDTSLLPRLPAINRQLASEKARKDWRFGIAITKDTWDFSAVLNAKYPVVAKSLADAKSID